jgi:hypothetical protein
MYLIQILLFLKIFIKIHCKVAPITHPGLFDKIELNY